MRRLIVVESVGVSVSNPLKPARLIPPFCQEKHLVSIFKGDNHPPPQAVSHL